ncbi:MAG: energy-coupling factor transporter ATPase [Termitinemataceae bacterium]|nr:MAG: energy-coupling factor transporter ATPase [Termitinemataceae bacterium]
MITVKNLNYTYFSGREALKDINLQINKGEFVAIVGHNGSGKSTLARIIAGIDRPGCGTCMVDSINTKNRKKLLLLRKTVGIVFQNPENQLVFEKARDDIAFGLKNLGFEKNEIEKRIDEVVTMLKIENFTNSFELSMGQKQRLAIASVLAMKPECIIFDEPTAMLDPKGKKDIHRIIVDLHQRGMTIVYVTNVIDEVLAADRIVILDQGSIRYEFLREELFENIDKLKKLGLEMPVIMEIISRLQSCGLHIDTDTCSIDDLVYNIVKKVSADVLSKSTSGVNVA